MAETVKDVVMAFVFTTVGLPLGWAVTLAAFRLIEYLESRFGGEDADA